MTVMDKKRAGFTFEGIGTKWCILTDGAPLSEDARISVLAHVGSFNERFSRFLFSSETCAFRNAAAGTYPVSDEFAKLLSRADELRRLTGGRYDPAVGGLLEEAGYDAAHSMTPRQGTAQFVLPAWSLMGRELTIDGPVVFDIGGIGKGYCIDRVAGILEQYGHRHYLVDGGGDMYGTKKRGGEAWHVALEYPGKSDTAAGVVELEDQGIAVSDSFRRRWDTWHNIVDPLLRTPIERVVGAVAVAKNAWTADCVTSALFLSDEEQRPAIARSFPSEFLVFRGDETARVSPNWSGELFLSRSTS